MSVDTERRKKLRNCPRSLVYVELESANGGMMRDLSEEGFALRAMMPLRAGEKTQFAFSLDEVTRISGEGRIVWIKEDGRVAGIEFCGIPRNAREQIREWLAGGGQPTARGHKHPAIAVPEASTLEELREEARSTLSRAAQPSVEAVEAAPSPEPEIAAIVIPAPPRLEEPREEGRRTLPRLVLPSVEGAKTAPSPLPDTAAIAQPQPAEIAELAAAPTTSVTPLDPAAPTELHDIRPETAPVAAPEPLPTKSVIEPRPESQPETEFSEKVDEHSVRRSLLMRTIGMMFLLVLIAGGVVFHREVGHALIWLGQVIATQDGNTPPPSATLSIISNPDGADIEVDGAFLGNTPAELQLQVGQRTIAIAKKGYKTYQRTIQLVSESKQRVAVDLEAKRQN